MGEKEEWGGGITGKRGASRPVSAGRNRWAEEQSELGHVSGETDTA